MFEDLCPGRHTLRAQVACDEKALIKEGQPVESRLVKLVINQVATRKAVDESPHYLDYSGDHIPVKEFCHLAVRAGREVLEHQENSALERLSRE